MIYTTLQIISNKFEQYISSKFNLGERVVLLSSPANIEAGTEITNKILVSLLNIERDTSAGIRYNHAVSSDDQAYSSRPSIHINLHVLVSANFIEKNYDESLKYLSSALEMVQANDLLTLHNTPELNLNISKLHLELENIGYNELSNIWSMMGGKLLPSFLLKIRMLTINAHEITSREKAARDVTINT